MERKAINWFSRTTSIAGMQVSNWILAIVAVVVDDLLSIHSLKHAHPILRRTRAAGSGGGEAVGQDHNEAKAIGRFYGTRQREVHCDVRFTPESGHW
jgi:hypothetical protein